MDFKLLKERGGKNEMQLNIKLTKEKRNCKNKNGVTLIALVVTIVVLLILAGVSINALFGNSGIIQKAKDAQNKMNQAAQNDLNALDKLNEWIDEKGTTGKAPEVIEKYILGENKEGIVGTTIFDINTNKFISNNIIPDAEKSVKLIEMQAGRYTGALIFEYEGKQYIGTVDPSNYMTKTVKVYAPRKIFDGSIKLEDSATRVGILEELTLTKMYKIVYTENGEKLENITDSGPGVWGAPTLLVSNKFYICKIIENETITLIDSKSEGKEFEIKQIYEIGDSGNFVEENGFMAYLENGEWGIMNTPEGNYTVPTTIKGKKITTVYLDFMSGNAIFNQPFKMDSFVDKMIGINTIKVTTSDVNFIFDAQSYGSGNLKEIDLTECGNDIEIPTDFATAYSNVTIYVSQAVKGNYQKIENIKVKE